MELALVFATGVLVGVVATLFFVAMVMSPWTRPGVNNEHSNMDAEN